MSDEMRPTTPRVKQLMDSANDIAREMNHSYIGTEHIFLAFFRLNDGAGKNMLIASGATEEGARSVLDNWQDPTKQLRKENAELRAKLDAISKAIGQ